MDREQAHCPLTHQGERILRYEIFAVTDADRAVARFAELCAGQAA